MYFVYLKHNIIMPASRATILNYACVLVKCDVKTGAYYCKRLPTTLTIAPGA